MTILHILVVGIGGFIGAIARFFVSKHLNSILSIPLGTLTVNLVGALFLGLISGSNANIVVVLLLGTGFMGAFTTFSTLKLEMLTLYKSSRKLFIIYTLLTYGVGIFFAFIGYLLGGLLL
jgi:fluoride exporter